MTKKAQEKLKDSVLNKKVNISVVVVYEQYRIENIK